MNPYENSIYNILNDERSKIIKSLPDIHKEAERDAMIAIRKMTVCMMSLMKDDSNPGQ